MNILKKIKKNKKLKKIKKKNHKVIRDSHYSSPLMI